MEIFGDFCTIFVLGHFAEAEKDVVESHRSSSREPLSITAIMSGESRVGFSTWKRFLHLFHLYKKRKEGKLGH